MNRPYIVCYMMTSVDGRIDCEMTGSLAGVEEYYPLLDELNLKSAVCGRVTAELEMAEAGKFTPYDSTAISTETISKKADNANGYDIVADTKGALLWKNANEYDKPLLIITSEQVSREYLAYLDSKGISYIAAGKDSINLHRAAEILLDSFGVERLGVVGGSAINSAFLDAGLLDEVIILIGAGIDGRASFAPVFNRDDSKPLVPLKLIEAKAYESGAVLIRYSTVNG